MAGKSLKTLGTILTLVAVSAIAAAAITLTFSNTSPVTTAVTPPPVVFVAGADSGTGTYVTGWTLSTNQTYFSVTVKGVPEMALVIGDLFHVHNQDTAAHTVGITAASLSGNSAITTYTIKFYDGASLVGTLDLKAASPSVTLSNVAASATYTARVDITLATGAGNNNAAVTSALTMTVT